MEEANREDIEKEALKQLTGIKIIIILSLVVFCIYWLNGILISCEESYYYGAASGFGVFMIFTVIFGGLVFLSAIGLMGLNKKRAYAVPVGRAILILFSIFTGFIPVGIIVLVLFWGRFKIPLVKKHLNYQKIV